MSIVTVSLLDVVEVLGARSGAVGAGMNPVVMPHRGAGGKLESTIEEMPAMARAVPDIYKDIQALSDSEKEDLLRALVADLDAPADPEVEKAWLEEAQRRYQELAEGKVKGVPGHLVFERLRSRLGR